MSETFARIAAGHYRNAETGVEIVKVSADEAGQRGWHVTVPAINGFAVAAIGRTMSEVKDAYVLEVRTMQAAINYAHEDAIADEGPIHHIARYDRKISCGETGRVRISEVAREVTCQACDAADDARRLEVAHAEALTIDAEALIADSDRSFVIRAEQGAPGSSTRTAFLRGDNVEQNEAMTRGFGAPEHDPDPTPVAHREALGGFREQGERVWHKGRMWDVDVVATGEGGRVCLTLHADWDNDGPEEIRNVYADDVLADNHALALTHDRMETEFQRAISTGWIDRIKAVRERERCGLREARQGALDEFHVEALAEQARRDAAQIIADARAPRDSARARWDAEDRARADAVFAASVGIPAIRIDGQPMSPTDRDDDAAWAAYCAALPQPTDREVADVLAEYGDPYAALRADAVKGFKTAARSIWRIRARAPHDQLHDDLIANLRSQMRTFRGVIEVLDQLTESWRLSIRGGADRASFTVKWADGVVTRVPKVL